MEFLPGHAIVKTGGDNGITSVAAAPFGSASILPITYGYIKMLGANGLRRVTEMAIVNANYMASALKGEYDVVYTGETIRRRGVCRHCTEVDGLRVPCSDAVVPGA